MNASQIETRIALSRVRRVLEIFRALDKDTDMPIGEAIAFIDIALGEGADGSGISVTDLKISTGYSLSAVSRYAQDLGEVDRRRNPGLKLISDQIDPMERRKKVLRLTPRGRTLRDTLAEALTPRKEN